MPDDSDRILARMFVVMGFYEALKTRQDLRDIWATFTPSYRQAFLDLMIEAAACNYNEDVVDAIERQMVKGI